MQKQLHQTPVGFLFCFLSLRNLVYQEPINQMTMKCGIPTDEMKLKGEVSPSLTLLSAKALCLSEHWDLDQTRLARTWKNNRACPHKHFHWYPAMIIHLVHGDEEKETEKDKRLQKESSTVKSKPTIMMAETQLSAGPLVTLCTTVLEMQSLHWLCHR